MKSGSQLTIGISQILVNQPREIGKVLSCKQLHAQSLNPYTPSTASLVCAPFTGFLRTRPSCETEVAFLYPTRQIIRGLGGDIEKRNLGDRDRRQIYQKYKRKKISLQFAE